MRDYSAYLCDLYRVTQQATDHTPHRSHPHRPAARPLDLMGASHPKETPHTRPYPKPTPTRPPPAPHLWTPQRPHRPRRRPLPSSAPTAHTVPALAARSRHSLAAPRSTSKISPQQGHPKPAAMPGYSTFFCQIFVKQPFLGTKNPLPLALTKGNGFFFTVRKGGLEPPRSCDHWHLKPARLPIPPLAHYSFFIVAE